MKKLFSISVVLLFIFAITFTSCQKQNLQQNSVNEQTTLTKVLNFKHKVENPTSKNNDLMSVDSAVWYIEALLNYNYCIVEDSNSVTYTTREDSLSLEISSDLIEESQVVEAYFEIEEKVLDLMNKGLKSNLVDVYVKNNKLYYLQVLEQPIEGKPTPIGGFNGFTEPAYYYNADELITSAVNNHIKVTTPYGFYTDIETVSDICADFHYSLRNNASNDRNDRFFHLLYEGSGDFDPYGTYNQLLNVVEMNFYYYGAYTSADILQQEYNISSDKVLKSINYIDDYIPVMVEYPPFLHWGNFTYANFTKVSGTIIR